MTDTRNITVPSVTDLVTRFVADAATARDDLVRDYRDADRGTKARIRTNVDKAFKSAFSDEKYDVAKSIMSVVSDLTTVSEKAPIDVNAEIGTLVANYLNAALAAMRGNVTFAGNTDNAGTLDEWDATEVSALSDMIDTMDLPDVSDETVERLNTVRIGRKARSNDIPDLVVEAFDNVPSGTFLKVSDIRERIATIHPELDVSGGWDGRVSAALFVNNDAKGVEGIISVGGPNKVNPDEWRNHGKNGAIKA